jgi:hypothetical protein
MLHKLSRIPLLLAGTAIVLGACAAPRPATEASEVTPTDAPTLAATESPAPWNYVAFGDSWPYGAHCFASCRPFPVLYKEGLESIDGHPISFTNLTTPGGTSESLLQSIRTDEKIRDAVKTADIIVIATGGNDLEPAFDRYVASTCGGADQLDCFREIAEAWRNSFDGMLREITALRAAKPTAIRVITYSNEFLADPGLIELFGPEFGLVGGAEVMALHHDVLCEVAAKYQATCVDLRPVLNGPHLDQPQDVNTLTAMQAVADALLASGLDELY